MPSKMYNRARMTVTSTGTGNLSLGVAVAGYQTFSSSGAQNGDTVSYTIEDGVNWEVGTGTFNSVAGTLSRTVTQSYNGTTYGTSAISVTTNAQVYITALAADIVVSGGALGTPSSATLTNATGLPLATGVTGTLPVANGGTGLTSLTDGRILYGNGTGAFGNSSNLFWDAATTRLGIGTASPAASIQIAAGNLRLANSAQIEWGGSTNAIEGNGSSNFLRFWTNNSPAMMIDASGNLGLGVTPSAWRTDAVTKALQIGKGALFTQEAGSLFTNLASNVYQPSSGVDTYITNAAATKYVQNAGQHQWSTAASGTAGNAISFTQAMTLDANGNLGVGTTSPGSYGRFAALSNGAYVASIVAISDSSLANWARVDWKNQNVATNGIIYLDQGGSFNVRNDGAYPLCFLTNATERARIDANGNLIINTAAIATNATNGFLYVPTCAGTPTGTPTTYTGRSPIVVDTTNNKLYFYSGGAWRDAGP